MIFSEADLGSFQHHPQLQRMVESPGVCLLCKLAGEVSTRLLWGNLASVWVTQRMHPVELSFLSIGWFSLSDCEDKWLEDVWSVLVLSRVLDDDHQGS